MNSILWLPYIAIPWISSVRRTRHNRCNRALRQQRTNARIFVVSFDNLSYRQKNICPKLMGICHKTNVKTWKW